MPRIIDVIEAPNQGPNDMVLRQPEVGSGDFRLGSQVIVRESQTAVFFPRRQGAGHLRRLP